MKREIIVTNDGSHTIAIPAMGVTYHSVHGAIQESKHIFIDAGFNAMHQSSINILEAGFGTGLNALLTLAAAEEKNIQYTAIETHSLSVEEATALNYCKRLDKPELEKFFIKMHTCAWEQPIAISPFFTLHKINQSLQQFQPIQQFNLVYFDAFAPAAQPELWTEEIFRKMFICLETHGRLLTYCSKGNVRRAMISAGFTVKKLPGPPGKREILSAIKV
ncbi:MAG: tRNA (5-methylaminomethyl-2-thiouridine)(34)-methyltransferase MnmD [Chitinophagaceae bacterium]|nr:tRNA (5-methylaminomethyl-2-thiouridine)(34)-methyltransferase MnmD [Chitinophagaceae bacterium]